MKKVLLCRPDYFRVDYKINPWMKIGSVNQKKALTQWNNLVKEYKKLGLKVEIIKQNKKFPDMVFTADQGILLKNKNILLSRFRHPERRGESRLYENWYKNNGYRITSLPKGQYFEGGGELQHWKDLLLIGTGFRTNRITAKITGEMFNKNIINLKLVNKQFYHLDTCLMVLNNDTIFYYPRAFSKNSVTKLKSLVQNLLEIDEKEVNNFAANSVIVNSTVLIQSGNNKMVNQIKKLNYKIIEIDMGEFMKAGGGIHCLTGNLGEI